ncbi:50S ribosomal protein L3 [Candidatus Woesebacteria bacterium RIFOXYA1_FULL_40_18]|uniref:Large ribosomal subunit protein uL3 n=5 Tax=Candidatus Woeseibacteriota TaxID=1752722 RepID=A0A0G0SMF2_9BACT|nr:MAG: 50S ribosomal protein L3 [Candidatus Woesebacteria bacterium GW2011_GWB1_40_101]KKR63576.1 MAG: 50S ribosomal protein L3 [Candidatus Woesebacteria bacterium GW2011_GWA1_40_45]OGM76456.1 MAG: 50S ribosomal protein L3 [Candidatus Woesebacteria bacterium RIFOXYA1_FULL_40_18]OGM81651.1 MAG: 50S ribosomal protein L3 [Candidatus Woesebacteria bacterium RIFOXYB1_FULL_40_26]OGM87857.1 MAG: 50S ribosomal protein L3 [Candidatus Woesebacteria bacterium RIFOXYD1_FULL_40_21]
MPPAPFFVGKDMINTILGSKGKMGQTFVEGRRVSVTEILAGPCIVTQIKKAEKDGYWAIQLGFGERKIKNTSKALQGHLKKTLKLQDSKTQKFPRYLREVRVDKEPEYKVGDEIKASDIFRVGDYISTSATSKGKGFAGVVKRWHFAGGPRTHGQSDRERAPGSIGQGTTPGRVFKGKHMAGRMGSDKVTIKNLQIVSVEPDKGEIKVSGPIPGKTGSLVVIKKISEGKLEGAIEVVAQVVEGAGAEAKTEEVKTSNA